MKRKAPDPEADASSVARETVERCKAWRDRCGRAFNVRTPRAPECSAERLTLRVTRFDRLRCDAVLRLRAPRSAAARHAVSGFEATLARGEIAFHITRVVPGAADPPLQAVADYETRLPPMHGVLPEDLTDCSEAARALVRHAATAPAELEVRRRAETYDVALVHAASVSHLACLALARWAGSYIDFERHALVAVVPRRKPEV